MCVASSKLEDYLSDRRIEVSLEANLIESANDEVRTRVQIVDVSAGGCCVAAPTSIHPDREIILEFRGRDEQPSQVLAQPQWHRVKGDGSLVGCRFLSNDAHEIVQQAIKLQESESTQSKPPHRLLPWLCFGGLALQITILLINWLW